MKKLSKAQQSEMDELGDKCASAADELEKAVDAYNAALVEAKERLEAAKTEYNDELAGLREFVEGLHTDASDYQGERSEKWQEGDAGQQYQSWMDSMEGISELDALDFDIPDDLEQPDLPDWEDRSFLPAVSPDEM